MYFYNYIFAIKFYYFKILMNVNWERIIAVHLPYVLIPLDLINAHVTLVTLAMAGPAQVMYISSR